MGDLSVATRPEGPSGVSIEALDPEAGKRFPPIHIPGLVPNPSWRNPKDVANCSIFAPEPHAIVTPPDDRWPMTDDLAGEGAISHESG